MRSFLLVLAVLAVSAPEARAFPHLVRHGYVQCSTCHVNPSGGGLVTEYGRGLSASALSTWGSEKESRFAYFVDKIENVDLGGDFRTAEVYLNTPRVQSGRLILMQADVEAGVGTDLIRAVGTLGYQERATPNDPQFLSRRHYLISHPIEGAFAKAGKFQPTYGLNLPDHVTFIRRGTGFNDQGSETYGVEAGWEAERWGAKLSHQVGNLGVDTTLDISGWTAMGEYAITDRAKLGLSANTRADATGSRSQLAGLHGILGWENGVYAMSEWDLTWARQPDLARGFASLNRVGYEFIQGMHVYGQHELLRTDFANSATGMASYGLGGIWFPRPHFDLALQWNFQTRANTKGYSDYAYFIFHFYP